MSVSITTEPNGFPNSLKLFLCTGTCFYPTYVPTLYWYSRFITQQVDIKSKDVQGGKGVFSPLKLGIPHFSLHKSFDKYIRLPPKTFETPNLFEGIENLKSILELWEASLKWFVVVAFHYIIFLEIACYTYA